MAGGQGTKKAKGMMGTTLWGRKVKRWESQWQSTNYYEDVKGTGCAYWVFESLAEWKASPVCTVWQMQVVHVGIFWALTDLSSPRPAPGEQPCRSERLDLLEDFHNPGGLSLPGGVLPPPSCACISPQWARGSLHPLSSTQQQSKTISGCLGGKLQLNEKISEGLSTYQ